MLSIRICPNGFAPKLQWALAGVRQTSAFTLGTMLIYQDSMPGQSFDSRGGLG